MILCYRNIPLSVVLAVPLVTAIYLLMNVSYLTVLSVQEMISAPAVAVVTLANLLKAVFFSNIFFRNQTNFVLSGIRSPRVWTFFVHHSAQRGRIHFWLCTNSSVRSDEVRSNYSDKACYVYGFTVSLFLWFIFCTANNVII